MTAINRNDKAYFDSKTLKKVNRAYYVYLLTNVGCLNEQNQLTFDMKTNTSTTESYFDRKDGTTEVIIEDLDWIRLVQTTTVSSTIAVYRKFSSFCGQPVFFISKYLFCNCRLVVKKLIER